MRKFLISKCLFALLLSSSFVYMAEKCTAEDDLPMLPSDPASTTSMPSVQTVIVNLNADGEKMNDIKIELMPIKPAEEFIELCKNNNSTSGKDLSRFSLSVMGESIFLVDNSTLEKASDLSKPDDKMMMVPRPIGKVVGDVDKTKLEKPGKVLVEQCWIPMN